MKSNFLTVVLVVFILGFSITNTGAQPIGAFKGTLLVAFFNEGSWHSNSFSVDLQSQPPHWHLTLKAPGWHKEMFVDSNSVEIVNYFDDVVPTKNGPNTAQIKLFPTSRPLGSPAKKLSGLRYFPGIYFLGKMHR
ncbi:MAG: hypothetical protein WCR20_22865 [Verrucomicrobiota bacterium]